MIKVKAFEFRCKDCGETHYVSWSRLKNLKQALVYLKCPYKTSTPAFGEEYELREFKLCVVARSVYKKNKAKVFFVDRPV